MIWLACGEAYVLTGKNTKVVQVTNHYYCSCLHPLSRTLPLSLSRPFPSFLCFLSAGGELDAEVIALFSQLVYYVLIKESASLNSNNPIGHLNA